MRLSPPISAITSKENRMSPGSLLYVGHLAKKFAALALTVEPMYPSFEDEGTRKHFVPGPGIQQVEELAKELKSALHKLLKEKPVLPEIDVDVVNESLGWLR